MPVPTVGSVHEWYLDQSHAPGADWLAPLGVMMWMADRSLASASSRRVVFVGARTWAYPPAMLRSFSSCVWINADTARARLWAIDSALRCRGVGVVIADASGFDLTATRRVQLAAERGGAIGLLARPPTELRTLSACGGRWRVTPEVVDTRAPGWRVELVRCKGVQPAHGARCWSLRLDHATGDVRVVAQPVDRPAQAPPAPRRQTG